MSRRFQWEKMAGHVQTRSDKIDIVKVAMSKETFLESSKNVLGGTPVFKGTRVPVKTLMDYLQGGDTLDDFLRDFPTVKRDQARQFLNAAKEALV
jgi:uncharacterized protein (DUF433 family)